MQTRCPFYGFHWPNDANQLLYATDDSQCGLDVNEHGPCAMEAEGHTADFDQCPLVRSRSPFLEAFRAKLHFKQSDETVVSFNERLASVKRRPSNCRD